MSTAELQRGVQLFQAGRLVDAEKIFRALLVVNPQDAEAMHLLGAVSQRSGRLDEAIPLLQAAALKLGHRADVLNNLGSALHQAGRLPEAEATLREAIRLRPQYPIAFYNLGRVLRESGRTDDSIEAYETAIRFNPHYAKAHFSLGLILLQRGDWAGGLDEYEWRWQRADISTPKKRVPQPEWDGSEQRTKTVLLHCEQGLGDTINFIRYASLVAKRVAGVIAEVQPELMRLVKTVAGVDQVIAIDEPPPRFDLHLPIMSLPRIFQTRVDSIPSHTPYMLAPLDEISRWRDRLKEFDGKFKVGVAWSGNPKQERNKMRSMPLKTLAPLAQIEGVQLFSLQKFPPDSDVADAVPLIDYTADFHDMADTAALMSNLDLIISTDTSVPHLAGALARPVWLMLAHDPDWRYLLDRDSTDWYPTMRLFRQEQRGQWDNVIARVAHALKQALQQGQ